MGYARESESSVVLHLNHPQRDSRLTYTTQVVISDGVDGQGVEYRPVSESMLHRDDNGQPVFRGIGLIDSILAPQEALALIERSGGVKRVRLSEQAVAKKETEATDIFVDIVLQHPLQDGESSLIGFRVFPMGDYQPTTRKLYEAPEGHKLVGQEVTQKQVVQTIKQTGTGAHLSYWQPDITEFQE